MTEPTARHPDDARDPHDAAEPGGGSDRGGGSELGGSELGGSDPGGSDPGGGSADRRERLRRWRLVLGDGGGDAFEPLAGRDAAADTALAALYDAGGERGADDATTRRGERAGNLGSSAPRVARWLGDVREHFPSTVVQVMQADAIDRLNLTRLLLEPEMLAAVTPDVHLVGTLLSLGGVLPDATKAAARQVVRQVVDDLERRFAQQTRAAVAGALNRAARVNRPRRPADVDWHRTIRANLRHYQPALGTVIPQRLVGYGRRATAVQRDVVLCVDQSGSMAASVVYSGMFAAVLASMRTLRTSMVVFDTAVVDLTDRLGDPVEVLFGTQLGGGTDVNRAIAYSQQLITRPRDTILVLISDLYEGGAREQMLRRIGELTAAGVQVVVLLALSDEGAPAYDRENAAALAALGVPAFACTPDVFPELMAAAIERRDLTAFAASLPDRPASR
jgi:Mg-chelatase subunit ChlD